MTKRLMTNKQVDLRKLLKQGKLKTELDLERVTLLYRKLVSLSDQFPDLKKDKEILYKMIDDYENKHWCVEKDITDKQIEENDLAEYIVAQEQQFIVKRKDAIKIKLKEYGLTQQQLGTILGHNSKSYMSELINGISPLPCGIL